MVHRVLWPSPSPSFDADALLSSIQILSSTPLRAISLDKESFLIPAAPDMIPDGDWVKVPGGNVVTAKGFKATGEHRIHIAWTALYLGVMATPR